MARITGTYRTTVGGDEKVNAFIPFPLPPKKPPLVMDAKVEALHDKALAAVKSLAVVAITAVITTIITNVISALFR